MVIMIAIVTVSDSDSDHEKNVVQFVGSSLTSCSGAQKTV